MTRTDGGDILIGYFYAQELAEKALAALRRQGFRDDQVRVTLCEAELESAGPRPAFPFVGVFAGALAVGVLTPLAALGATGVAPAVPAASWVGALLALLLGLLLGRLVAQFWARLRPCPAAASSQLSRGIVTVWPDGRDEVAAAILMHYAGCGRDNSAAGGLR